MMCGSARFREDWRRAADYDKDGMPIRPGRTRRKGLGISPLPMKINIHLISLGILMLLAGVGPARGAARPDLPPQALDFRHERALAGAMEYYGFAYDWWATTLNAELTAMGGRSCQPLRDQSLLVAGPDRAGHARHWRGRYQRHNLSLHAVQISASPPLNPRA